MTLLGYNIPLIIVLTASLWPIIEVRPPPRTDKQQQFSGLKNIPNGNYGNVETLKLHSIAINELTTDYFTNRGFYNLQKLFIKSCNISPIHENAFRNMTQLELLLISQNELTVLYNYSFAGLTSLKRLNLANNKKLTSIDKEAFAHLACLEFLDLSNNAIKELDSELLEGTAVTELNLENNPLTLNQSGPILKSKVLRWLNLQSCNIQNLPTDAFALLPQLEGLDLSRNPLKELPVSLAEHNPQLNSLDIDCAIMDNNVAVLCSLSTLDELPCPEYRLETQWDCTQFLNNEDLALNSTKDVDPTNGFKPASFDKTEIEHTMPKEEGYQHTTKHIHQNDLSSSHSTGDAKDDKSKGLPNVGQSPMEKKVSSSNDTDVTDRTTVDQGKSMDTLGVLVIALLVVTIIVVCLAFVIGLRCYNQFRHKNTPAPVGEQVAFINKPVRDGFTKNDATKRFDYL